MGTYDILISLVKLYSYPGEKEPAWIKLLARAKEDILITQAEYEKCMKFVSNNFNDPYKYHCLKRTDFEAILGHCIPTRG